MTYRIFSGEERWCLSYIRKVFFSSVYYCLRPTAADSHDLQTPTQGDPQIGWESVIASSSSDSVVEHQTQPRLLCFLLHALPLCRSSFVTSFIRLNLQHKSESGLHFTSDSDL